MLPLKLECALLQPCGHQVHGWQMGIKRMLPSAIQVTLLQRGFAYTKLSPCSSPRVEMLKSGSGWHLVQVLLQ